MRMRSFASFLICLFGALILAGIVDNARAAGPHYVFAHYMVAEPTYGPSVAGFERDIQDAQAAGIDGFALDLGAYDDPTQTYYNADVAFMYTAAQTLGTGFKLFFSVEFTNTTSIVNLLSTYAGRTNTFFVGTNMVVSTYTAESVDWQN
jgi:glucan endo-1,3-alpha-glucosidase